MIDGRQRPGGDLETHLIVAAHGAAVRDGRRPFHPGDLDELLRNQRACERGGERIAILVERVGLQRRNNVLARELVPAVEHVRSRRSERERALPQIGELAPLPQVHGDRDDLGAVSLREPRDRNRGVESAGVPEDDSLH